MTDSARYMTPFDHVLAELGHALRVVCISTPVSEAENPAEGQPEKPLMCCCLGEPMVSIG